MSKQIATREAAQRGTRLAGIDRLRVALTAGVIATHAIITYAANGSWFYHEGHLPKAVDTLAGIPLALGALFGMGAFFFVAGLFLPGALDRHGSRALLRERVVRLGLPTLVFVLLVVPLVQLWVAAAAGPSASARTIWLRQLRMFDTGPLWFAWVLLLFSAVAVGLLGRAAPPQPRPLRAGHLILAGLLVAAGSFLLRLRFQIDSYQWGAAHVWQWSQCVVLFALGVIAGRRGWHTQIPSRIRRGCLVVAGVGAVITVALLALFADDLDPLGGGWHWQSLIVCIVEGAMSVSLTAVLVTLFGDEAPGRLAGAAIPAAYGAYLVQAPVLVAVALAMRGLAWPTTVKLIILVPAGIGLSFAAAVLLRRIPALRPALR